MSPTTQIPDPSVHGVITFDLLSEGNVIDPGYEVIGMTITREVNRVPVAQLTIRDGNAADETFEISNADSFAPGKELIIKVGRDGNNEQAFKGIIIKHGIKVGENGQSNLMIECKDEAVKMTIGRHSQYYEEFKDSEVIESLVSKYGLTPEVDDTGLQHKELVQHHVTDWDYMLSRAEVNGKLTIVEDGKITIASPDTSQEPEINLHYGQNLLEFQADMDVRNQWKKVKGQAWDFANQQLFEAETESANFDEPGNIAGEELAEAIDLEAFEVRHSGHLLEQELQDWVDATMLRSRLAKIRGRAKTRDGYLGIKPGKMIQLEGVGERFEGKAYISGIRHDIQPGAWDTHIQFGLDPKWFACREDIIDFPAAGLIPGVRGLQIGKVIQLQDDPAGEHRIKVKIPVVDHQSAGIWCRIACLDAGNERGTFFRPEIDDEVIIGFINDDPRDAVVLGMLNSSALPAPLDAQDQNHEKGIFTRSKMRIHFDDEQKIITIDTPTGNSIKLDEAGQSINVTDQNDNKVVMESGGISMESPQEISITAGTSLTLSAGTTLSIGGANIAVEADGMMEIKGATSKLQANGIAEVKGSVVRIN